MKSYLSSSELDEDSLEEIVDNENIIASDELQTLIVALDQRKGADIEGFFDSEKDFEDFIELLNHLGMNCFVLREPEHTEVENFAALFDEETLDSTGFKEMLEKEVRTRIYITKKDSYNTEFFEKLEEDDSYSSSYHKRRGEFYGYIDEDIEAFVYQQRPKWQKFILRIFSRDRPSIGTEEAFEKYGEEYSEEEKRVFMAFIAQKLADSQDSFEKNMERALNTREALEEAGIDPGHYVESLEL